METTQWLDTYFSITYIYSSVGLCHTWWETNVAASDAASLAIAASCNKKADGDEHLIIFYRK